VVVAVVLAGCGTDEDNLGRGAGLGAVGQRAPGGSGALATSVVAAQRAEVAQLQAMLGS
jgi:hypothetical protein